jgi:hypothetical protein
MPCATRTLRHPLAGPPEQLPDLDGSKRGQVGAQRGDRARFLITFHLLTQVGDLAQNGDAS